MEIGLFIVGIIAGIVLTLIAGWAIAERSASVPVVTRRRLIEQIEDERNWYFRDKEYLRQRVTWSGDGGSYMKQAEDSLDRAIDALKAGRDKHAYDCLMHASDMFSAAMDKYKHERTLSNLRNHRILSLISQAKELAGEP